MEMIGITSTTTTTTTTANSTSTTTSPSTTSSTSTTTTTTTKPNGPKGEKDDSSTTTIDSKLRPNAEQAPPVPNFRVEGNDNGDSLITVSVGVLTTLSSANLVKSDTECVSLVDSSLGTETETEEPGATTASTNEGDLLSSLQSSEPDEMPLSLVSWYSEPGDFSSGSHCCQHQNDSSKHSISDFSDVSATTPTAAPTTKDDLTSEEKENKTPSAVPKSQDKESLSKNNEQCSETAAPLSSSRKTSTQRQSASSSAAATDSNRGKMHVQVFEQKSETSTNSINGGGSSLVELNKDGRQRIECPRCTRRSKSGTTTPATANSSSRTSSRRVAGHHHHNSSSTPLANGSRELKKPIKSILKSESRSGGSGGSGSGSEKQSSMDSLGSNSGINTMSRSDSGPRTKFYFNNSSDSVSYPEDKMVSKLKRIEKYATLRLRKSRSGSKELTDEHADERRHRTSSGSNFIPDLMTKSMSFLEKATPQRGVLNSSGPSSLKRQGSLKIRKPSPGWEPGATRTSALRLLKMQENKAKTVGGSSSSSIGHNQGASGSTHSGSGESIHHSITSNCTPSSRFSANHASRSSATPAGVKERGYSSAKVFSKLSSASGQTASSSMKRLRQEKSVQTDSNVVVLDSSTYTISTTTSNNSNNNITTITQIDSPVNSPEPIFDASATITALDQQTEQIKQLESLVKRYKTSALKFQKEFERTENKNLELKRQLQETQMESTEMLEFLQAEKSTLAESLVEVESECKKLTRELESVVKESQSRCSSLARLSEQHKQETLKSKNHLTRLESDTKTMITQQSTQLTKGTEAIHGIKQQILSLIETLMKTYKVSQERLQKDGFGEGAGVSVDETELRCTLLLPLIKSLSNAFEVSKLQLKSSKQCIPNSLPVAGTNAAAASETPLTTNSESNSTTKNNNSLENKPAGLDRRDAETIGLQLIENATSTTASNSHASDDRLSLQEEFEQLQVALRKLCTVIRIIVIHCDQKVSNVASDILQVLKSDSDKLDLDFLDSKAPNRNNKIL